MSLTCTALSQPVKWIVSADYMLENLRLLPSSAAKRLALHVWALLFVRTKFRRGIIKNFNSGPFNRQITLFDFT